MSSAKVKGGIDCENCRFFTLCAPISICENSYTPVTDALNQFRKVGRGVKVCDQNRSIRSIYTVCKGVFKGTVTDLDGEERVVAFYLPGSTIGLEALDGANSSVDVEALSSAVVCELSVARLNQLRREFPRLQIALTQLLMQELRHYQEVVIALLGSRSAEEGLAAFLLYASARMSEAGFPPDYFDLPITYTEIANFLGLTRETITRLMAKMKKQNIVIYRGRKLEIIDRDALVTLAATSTETVTPQTTAL
jgi:CRP/FNR family transcriptional regulator